MSLEEIYFSLWIRNKLGEKEFLKLYIVLLRAELNCTIYASRMGRSVGASLVATWKSNVRFQKFSFPCFYIYSSKKIFFFQGHVLPTPFLSKNSKCGLIIMISKHIFSNLSKALVSNLLISCKVIIRLMQTYPQVFFQ